MKVLFAIRDESNIVNSIAKKFSSDFDKKLLYKEVSNFTAITKELQKNNDYDRIVISDDFDDKINESENKQAILLKKLKGLLSVAIGKNGKHIPIIFLSKSSKMANFMVEANILNLLVGKDVSKKNIYELIKKPRTKASAKEYYNTITTKKSEIKKENKKTEKNIKVSSKNSKDTKTKESKQDKKDENAPKDEDAVEVKKRGRGRPRKVVPPEDQALEEKESEVKVKRGRGRPRKNPVEDVAVVVQDKTNKTKKDEKTETKKEVKKSEPKVVSQIDIEQEPIKPKSKKSYDDWDEDELEIEDEVDFDDDDFDFDDETYDSEDVDIEDIDLDEDDDSEDYDLDEEDDLEDIDLDEEDDLEDIDLDEDDDFEDYDLDEEDDLEDIDLDEEDDLEDIDLDEEDDLEDIDLDEEDDLEDIDLDEEDDLEDIDLDEEDDLEDIDLDEEDDLEDIDLDEDDELEDIDLDEDDELEDIDLDEDDELEDIDLDEDDELEDIDLDEEDDLEDIDLDEEDDLEDIDLDEDDDIEEEIVAIDDDVDEDEETINLDDDEDDEGIINLDDEEDDDEGIINLDDEEVNDDEGIMNLDDEEDDDEGIMNLDDEEDEDEGIMNLDDEEDEDEGIMNLDDEEDEDEGIMNLDDEEDEDEGIINLDDEEEDTGIFDLDDNSKESNSETDDLINNSTSNDSEKGNISLYDEDDAEDDILNLDDNQESEENSEDELEDIDLVKISDNEDNQATGAFGGIMNKNYNPNYDISKQLNEINGIDNESSANSEAKSSDNSTIHVNSDQKIVAFVGAHNSGNSFIINNLAQLLSEQGVKTAILDLTKNKNSYYIYTENEENLRNIAYSSFEKLKSGIADGIKVNKNLTVYTALPNSDSEIDDKETAMKTLLNNNSLVLLDCDFDTDLEFFSIAQEVYFVQSFDILTIQALTGFIKKLKMNKIDYENKMKIIVNKYVSLSAINERAIVAAISVYNSPDTTYQLDLFDRNKVEYMVIPFEERNYCKYLDDVVKCKITVRGYSKSLINSLNRLSKMVYSIGKKK